MCEILLCLASSHEGKGAANVTMITTIHRTRKTRPDELSADAISTDQLQTLWKWNSPWQPRDPVNRLRLHRMAGLIFRSMDIVGCVNLQHPYLTLVFLGPFWSTGHQTLCTLHRRWRDLSHSCSAPLRTASGTPPCSKGTCLTAKRFSSKNIFSD